MKLFTSGIFYLILWIVVGSGKSSHRKQNHKWGGVERITVTTYWQFSFFLLAHVTYKFVL